MRRWLQHLQSGNSRECQVGYCDSSQVSSHSQYTSVGPEEWLQFPDQSKHETWQLHLWRQIYWVGKHSYIPIYFTFRNANIKSQIWWRLDYIIHKPDKVDNCLHWSLPFYINKPVTLSPKSACTYMCTYWWKPKLSACNSCIKSTPEVITHSAPRIVIADFHSTLVTVCTTSKPDVSISTQCCNENQTEGLRLTLSQTVVMLCEHTMHHVVDQTQSPRDAKVLKVHYKGHNSGVGTTRAPGAGTLLHTLVRVCLLYIVSSNDLSKCLSMPLHKVL